MSGGQHHLSAHQVQHGHHVAPQQAFSHHHVTADSHEVSAPLMDASHFAGFSYPFTGMPDQSHGMAMPAGPSPPLGYNDESALHYSHQQQHAPNHDHHLSAASCPPLSASMTSGPLIAPSNDFRATSETHRSSPGASDESTQDRNSPHGNSLEDSAVDDFGLSCAAHGEGTDPNGKVKDERSETLPAWSDLKTKAGKDRKRLPLACIACRRKKIRCSGEKPACKHCLRSRIPCVYKVTARKAAPRTDYMAMLDKRLKRMEERIIKIVPKVDHDVSPPVVRAVVKPGAPGSGPTPTKSTSSRKRGCDEAFGSDLEAWATGDAKVNSSDSGTDRAISAEAQQDEENNLFLEGLEALPSKEVQEHLAEVFFDNVYGQAYHLLHKPSYMRKLRNNSLPPVLVLSVCAVAARFTPNPKISPASRQFLRGEEWASHARDICTRRYEWPNVTILTCLLILGLHEFGTCHGGRSWALGGQAIRMAFALQLHKDLEYDPLCRGTRTPLSFVDREIRRRIMWACFLMDRFNSSGSDRPMFIKEQSIKIPLPVEERFFQLDMPVQAETLHNFISRSENLGDDSRITQAKTNMGVAAFTIRSIATWGRIVTYLNQGGKEADPHPMWNPESDYSKLIEEIEVFTRSLPHNLHYTPENLDLRATDKSVGQYFLLHLSIQQNMLFLSQAAVTFVNTGVGSEAPRDFALRVSARTFAAANRISEIIRDSEHFQCGISAPFAGYCAFSSTAIHIMSIFSGRPAIKAAAESNAGTNIRFLRKMMRYWGMFQWMVENIRTQYRNALHASQSGKASTGGSPTSLIQYGDWFNKYPHGVSDADLLDLTMKKKKEKGDDAVLEQKPELQSVEEFFTTLSPSQNPDSKGVHRVLQGKRKSVCRTSSDGAVSTRGSISELPKPDVTMGNVPNGRPEVHQDGVVRQQQQQRSPATQQPPAKKLKQQQQSQKAPQSQQTPRRISVSLGSQPSGLTGHSPLGAPQTQPHSYTSMSPLSPASLNPFTAQQLHQQQQQQPQINPHSFFSADMLSMNIPQQSQHPNGFVRPLGRQLSLSGFSVDSSNSGGMPDAHQNQAGSLPLTPGSMSNFGGQDPSWFLPLNMDSSEVNQPMGFTGNAGDPFANMFGMTPTQLHGLRHPM